MSTINKFCHTVAQLRIAEAELKAAHKLRQRWSRECGKRFRALRELKGWSLRATAKRLGVSAAYLSDVELGRKHFPLKWIEQIYKENRNV